SSPPRARLKRRARDSAHPKRRRWRRAAHHPPCVAWTRPRDRRARPREVRPVIGVGLADALRRLDALLARVCDVEETRAQRLYSIDRGWDSLRATLAPVASELAFDERVPESPLCPEHGLPALVRYREAIGLAPLEADALFVLLAPYLEPRYAKLYLVLQDDVP